MKLVWDDIDDSYEFQPGQSVIGIHKDHKRPDKVVMGIEEMMFVFNNPHHPQRDEMIKWFVESIVPSLNRGGKIIINI